MMLHCIVDLHGQTMASDMSTNLQEFAPVYEEAAKQLQSINSSILVAKVDAPENEDLAEEYDIDGLPTVKWFVDGEDSGEYNGEPDVYVDYCGCSKS